MGTKIKEGDWITWGLGVYAHKVLEVDHDACLIRIDDEGGFSVETGEPAPGYYTKHVSFYELSLQVVENPCVAPTSATVYPDGNPKTALGVSKPSMSSIPPVAMFTMGQALRDGKAKYGPMNWRENTVTSSIYYDAALRHLMAWWDGEDKAADSGVHHLGHAMACLGIILDAESSSKLNDDRPPQGTLPDFITNNTEKS